MSSSYEDLNNELINFCKLGDFEKVQEKLKDFDNINAVNGEAFIQSGLNNNFEIAKYLKDKKVKADSSYLLTCASRYGNIKAVKFALELGADIHTTDDYPIASAAKEGNLEIVKYLVENGANIYADEHLTLQWARESNKEETVYYLISQYELSQFQNLMDKHLNTKYPSNKEWSKYSFAVDMDEYIFKAFETLKFKEKLQEEMTLKNNSINKSKI